MVFIEGWYLLFLTLCVLSVWVSGSRFRPYVLLFACFVFHWHYAGPAGVAPIVALSVFTFTVLTRTAFAKKVPKTWPVANIALCLAALVGYRYLGLWAVPLAISFFTFEFVHLLSDRLTGRIRGTLPLRDFLLFIFFFPSLAAGPIKRWEAFHPQLKGLGWPGLSAASSGTIRILIGFFKKLVLVSWFRALLPEHTQLNVYNSTLKYGFFAYWLLYLDLSAYSDLAVGSAQLLGIQLPENLNWTPLANSFQSYWQRWHISVTQWFRDYVFYPLGRKSRSKWAVSAALLVAAVLSGLWHGPRLSLVIWGALNGAGILIEIALFRWFERKGWVEFMQTTPAKIVTWAGFQFCLLIQAVLFFYPFEDFVYQIAKNGVL